MDPTSGEMAILRERMVQEQLVRRRIQDAEVLRAMREVPRENFVLPEFRQEAYDDSPLPIEEGQTISQPYIVALMVQLLMLSSEDRVLDVGTGSGYGAVVLSRIAAEVYTVERLPSLARSAGERFAQLGYDNIHTLIANGTLGWPEQAPYNGIVFSAGTPRVPKPLLAQLATGGRLVGPVGRNPYFQVLIRMQRLGEHKYAGERWGEVRFVPMIGEEGWLEPMHRKL